MQLCILRATNTINTDLMETVAQAISTVLGIDYDLITEPFGNYNPDVVLERLAEIRTRYLDNHESAALFLLLDENAVESHGATVLGRAIAHSRIAVVRWRADPYMTAATCLHELGHALGLTNRHCDREECIMYPYARERQVQGKAGRELFCEECWRTISTDTIYESLQNASKERKSKLRRGIDHIRTTLTATSDRLRKPRPLIPQGTIHAPKPFPDVDEYQDEYSFLHAVLRYYGLGQESEEVGR